MRHRNRRVQSSHTVIVGATEPEQLRVKPIRIRQVHHASDTPNYLLIEHLFLKLKKRIMKLMSIVIKATLI